jgi:predicted transcriptional regulator
MGTTRITISLPDELAEALRLVAISTNESISGVAAEAVARRVREAELESLLGDIDAAEGPVSEAALAEARNVIRNAEKRRPPKSKKHRSHA